MRIEEEIMQKKFRDEYEKLLINILYTNTWISNKHKAFFDKESITPQQYNILRILRGAQQSLSTLQIRERMIDKMSDTSRIVDRLVLKGLVKKTTNKLDKRLVCITINTKGLALLKKMDAEEERMLTIMHNVSETEAKQLNTLLDKVRRK